MQQENAATPTHIWTLSVGRKTTLLVKDMLAKTKQQLHFLRRLMLHFLHQPQWQIPTLHAFQAQSRTWIETWKVKWMTTLKTFSFYVHLDCFVSHNLQFLSFQCVSCDKWKITLIEANSEVSGWKQLKFIESQLLVDTKKLWKLLRASLKWVPSKFFTAKQPLSLFLLSSRAYKVTLSTVIKDIDVDERDVFPREFQNTSKMI